MTDPSQFYRHAPRQEDLQPGHTPCKGIGTVCSGTSVERTIEGGSCSSTTQDKRCNNVYFHDLTQRAPSLHAEKLKSEKATERAVWAAICSTGYGMGVRGGRSLEAMRFLQSVTISQCFKRLMSDDLSLEILFAFFLQKSGNHV